MISFSQWISALEVAGGDRHLGGWPKDHLLIYIHSDTPKGRGAFGFIIES